MKYTPIFLLLTVVLFVQAVVPSRKEVLDAQIKDLLEQLRGQTVAILTNPTSVDSQMQPIFLSILAANKTHNITLKCFFAPQHGLRGDRQAGAGDDDYVDPETNIQVYSLYGVRKAPTAEQLAGVNILLYDIQDVGARFYTYIWTLTYTMEVIGPLNIKLVVFDRPNPLGRKIEGCPLTVDSGITGRLLPGQQYSLPIRYGLTVGEFVGYVSRFLAPLRWQVIKMKGVYELTESTWVMSSPNIPTLASVLIYPGIGLFQATSLSEGRGTTKPFQLSGNQTVQAVQILNYFKTNSINQTGYYLRQAYFIPTFSKFTNKICGGVEIMVNDSEGYNSVETALHLLKAYLSVGSINISTGIDRAFGKVGFFSNIRTKSVKEIMNDYQSLSDAYLQEYRQFWIYQPSQSPQNSVSID